MRSSIRKSLALLVAGLGLSATTALAEPKSGPPAKSDPPARVDPKTPAAAPKADPAPKVSPAPPAKVDPKPVPLPPKLEPKPLPLPLPPKVDPKPLPKPDVKPLPILPKADPKPVPDPVKPTTPKVDPRVPTLPVKPVEVHKPVIHEKPKTGGSVEMPKGPGLKLPAGTKFDHAELARIKPPIDLTKTKPEAVLASKPAADFKVKPVKLDSIHVPKDAPVVEKLNVTSIKNVTVNQTFVVNKSYYTGGDYHTKFGTKMSYGYCYPGMWHSHWHHCIWDPCFNCNYFYCPSACCYYYWCEVDYCYYPCHWFVDYGAYYYPWWICGGFSGYGYVTRPTISIFIGW